MVLSLPEVRPVEEGRGLGSCAVLQGSDTGVAHTLREQLIATLGSRTVFLGDWHKCQGAFVSLYSSEHPPLPGSSGLFLARDSLLWQGQESSCVWDLSTPLPHGSFVFLAFSHL